METIFTFIAGMGIILGLALLFILTTSLFAYRSLPEWRKAEMREKHGGSLVKWWRGRGFITRRGR